MVELCYGILPTLFKKLIERWAFLLSMIYLPQTIIEDHVMGEWSEYFEDFPEENPANRKSFENDLGEKAKHFPWALSQLTKDELAEEFRLRELHKSKKKK